MHPATEKLIHELKDLAIEAVACDYAQRGYHYEIEIEGKQIRSLAECLLKHEMYLVFVGGLHVKPACRVIYQFASFERPCRIVIRAVVDERLLLPWDQWQALKDAVIRDTAASEIAPGVSLLVWDPKK
jgi:hypothetical protein